MTHTATVARNDGDETTVREFHVEADERGFARLAPYDRKLSRLEFLVRREVIEPRQYSAGIWLAERWEAYFTPGASSGIEDHAPGSVPADPLARWTQGQRTTDARGRPRTPPPTFRPRRPSDDRRAHDGWSVRRCNALQAWVRANRLLQRLAGYDRVVVVLVAIDGLSLEEVVSYLTSSNRRAGGKQIAVVKRALQRGLDVIADEIEPATRQIVA